MLRSASSLRINAGLAALLPLAILVAACDGGQILPPPLTDTTASTGMDPSTSSATGSGGSGGVGGSGLTTSTTTGSGGAGGATSTATSTSSSTSTSAGTGGAGGSPVMPDTTPPTVVLTAPASAAQGVAANALITATFSEAMDPLTLTSATFLLKQGAVVIPAAVTYANNVATLDPTVDLALSTTYTATVTTTSADLAGNKLAMDHTWSFTTAAVLPKGPAPVLLGTAGNYVILAKSAISNVPTSLITGDLGLSPAAASFITGFSMTKVGTKWTSAQVVGSVFAADNDPPTPINLTTAVLNMMTAYTDAAGRPTPDALNLGSGTIGGLTILPGLYKWTSSVTIPTDLTLSGAPNDVWIFQVEGNLTMSAAKNITLIGGAKAKNIFWQVSGLVDLGTTSHAEGVILSKTSIKLGTGASINGRLLAQTAVNLATVTVTAPAP
jgi:hypothetical protein